MKRKHQINKQNKGFTLAELLVVVAIIGVLVAVSIPIFTSQLEKAKLATCLANRRSLLAEVRVKALDSDIDQEVAFNNLYPDNKANFPCPKGGTFSWKDGQIICSVHDGTGDSSSSTIDAGGEKITLNEQVTGAYSEGTTPTYKTGEICIVAGKYYVIKSEFSNYQVDKTYAEWFNDNLKWYSAEINQKAIYSLNDINTKKALSAGDLYSIGNDVYVATGSVTISQNISMVNLHKIGTLP